MRSDSFLLYFAMMFLTIFITSTTNTSAVFHPIIQAFQLGQDYDPTETMSQITRAIFTPTNTARTTISQTPSKLLPTSAYSSRTNTNHLFKENLVISPTLFPQPAVCPSPYVPKPCEHEPCFEPNCWECSEVCPNPIRPCAPTSVTEIIKTSINKFHGIKSGGHTLIIGNQ